MSTLKVATKHQALWQFIPVVPRVLAHGEEARPTVLPAGYPPPVSSSPACLSAQSCLTLCDPMDCSPTRLLHPWDFPGKNTGVGCHFLPPGDLLNPGTEPVSQVSLALADRFFTTSAIWEVRVLGPLHMQLHDKGTHFFKTPRY